jgi:radical SAM superfamily enzyme YgiQ (UPF0313 family)
MGKILFVRAPTTLKEIYGELAEAGNESAPLGLATLAAITREAGFDSEILDCAALRLGYKDSVREILRRNPDYIGFTSTTVYIENTAKLAHYVKKLNKKIITMIGGSHFSALPGETLKRYKQFDLGCVGEGDITIVELLKALDSGKDLKNVKGLMIRDKGKIIFTGEREMVKNLDELPMPAYDLLPDIRKYYMPPANSLYRMPSASMVTSRGCPMKCTFCANVIFKNNCRAHSTDYVMRVIKYLYYEFGIREIQFYEDNFTAYRNRLIEICKRLIKEKLDLNWWCMGSVNAVNPEILNLMKKSGCWQIAYGCESGSQEILDNFKKGVSVEQIEKAVKWTKEAGIGTKGFFMVGNPLETKETMKRTVGFIKKLPLDDFHITYFTPLPGSEVYGKVDDYGEFEDRWDKLSMFHPTFVPYGLSKKDIEKYYRKAYREFYLRPRTMLYILKKLKQPALRKKIFKSGLSFFKFLVKKEKY